MSKEMDNIQVVHRFKETLKNFQRTGNGRWTFLARAILKFGGKRIDDDVEVALLLNDYGDDCCAVVLQRSDKIDPDEHYIRFRPKYADFELNAGNELVIKEANSGKLGDYVLTIIPDEN